MTGLSQLEFDLLDAFDQPGDPIGRLAEDAVASYLDGLIYEAVNDPGVRDGLRRAGGFCGRHWWWLSRLGTAAFGATILLEDVIGTVRERLETGEPPQPAFRAEGHWVGHGPPCLACEIEAGAERRALAAWLRHATDPDWEQRYVTGPSALAVRHLPSLRASPVYHQTLAKLDLLLRELAEFKRKNDYRSINEAMGEEGTAWLRAIETLRGPPNDGTKRR